MLWLSHYSKHPTPEAYFRQRGKNLHTSDCRALAGAAFGQQPAVTYVEASVCDATSTVLLRPPASTSAAERGGRRTGLASEHPEAGAGGIPSNWTVGTLAADAAVDAICPAGRQRHDMDAVCSYAVAHAKCAAEGSDFVRCPLTPADRRAILGAAGGR